MEIESQKLHYKNVQYLFFPGVFPYILNHALHCGNKKLSRLSAWAGAIIHGESLGQNFILKLYLGFGELFLNVHVKYICVKCNKLYC